MTSSISVLVIARMASRSLTSSRPRMSASVRAMAVSPTSCGHGVASLSDNNDSYRAGRKGCSVNGRPGCRRSVGSGRARRSRTGRGARSAGRCGSGSVRRSTARADRSTSRPGTCRANRCRSATARRRRLRAVRDRRPLGQAVGHDVVPAAGHGARASGRGTTVEARIDFGTGVGAGFQSEGLLYRTAGGGPIRGLHPFHQNVPVELIADADGTSRRAGRGGRQSGGRGLAPAHTARRPRHRRRRAALPAEPSRARCPQRRRSGTSTSTSRSLIGLMRELGRRRPPSIRDPAGGRRRDGRPRPRRRRRAPPAWPGTRLAPVLGPAGVRPRPSTVGRRPRPHRLGLAVAAAGDPPQVRPHLLVGSHADGRVSRVPVRVLAGRAVRLDRARPTRAVRAHPRQGGRGAVRPGRVDVGRGRRQPPLGRVAGPPVRLGQAVLRRQVRRRHPRGLDPRRVRLRRQPAPAHGARPDASTSSPRSCRGTRPTTSPTTRSGGRASTAPGSSPTSPRPTPTTARSSPRSWPTPSATSATRAGPRRSMYLFGHGDGGGGPTREMLERARRVAGCEGTASTACPGSTIETPARVLRGGQGRLPRRAGLAGRAVLRDAPRHLHVAGQDQVGQPSGRAGPARARGLDGARPPSRPLADLERLWKVLLLHQFHDIIPGSSIAWVHDDTEAAHAALLAEVEALIRQALDAASGPQDRQRSDRWRGPERVGMGRPTRGRSTSRGVVDRRRPARCGSRRRRTASARSRSALPAGVAGGDGRPVDGDHRVLDNGLVRVRIARRRHHRLAGRPPGRPGVPRRARATCSNCSPTTPTPTTPGTSRPTPSGSSPTVLTEVDVDRRGRPTDRCWSAGSRSAASFGDSRITQRYVLRAGSARLDIVTDVDWHEDERLLKAAFPFDVRADDARYDIQYGHVRRPTHRNTSWDDARFEVCGHFWADLAEPDFGVAVLNDGKYGHDCLGVRPCGSACCGRPTTPTPTPTVARTTSRTRSCRTDPRSATVLAESWALNLPPRRRAAATARPSVVATDHPGVVITAVKAADDGSGDLVVRFHEAFGGRARGRPRRSAPGAGRSVVECDLLERPHRPRRLTARRGSGRLRAASLRGPHVALRVLPDRSGVRLLCRRTRAASRRDVLEEPGTCRPTRPSLAAVLLRCSPTSMLFGVAACWRRRRRQRRQQRGAAAGHQRRRRRRPGRPRRRRRRDRAADRRGRRRGRRERAEPTRAGLGAGATGAGPARPRTRIRLGNEPRCSRCGAAGGTPTATTAASRLPTTNATVAPSRPSSGTRMIGRHQDRDGEHAGDGHGVEVAVQHPRLGEEHRGDGPRDAGRHQRGEDAGRIGVVVAVDGGDQLAADERRGRRRRP